MLYGTLEESGQDVPDTLYPVKDTSDYEVRLSESGAKSLWFSSREAATTVAHRLNIYGKGYQARVIEWRLEGSKRIPIAL